MKPLSEKQRVAIYRLARATKTDVQKVEEMSSAEASNLISEMIEKMQADGRSGQRGGSMGNSFRSDALAGLAVKIVAQRLTVSKILDNEDFFKQKVKGLYRVFYSARRECLA